MPGGVTHYKFYKASMPIAFLAGLYFLWFYSVLLGLMYLIGYFIFGRYVDGDWDSVTATGAEGRIMNELKFFGYPIFAVSSFYGAIFRKRHRHFITHFPYFSTAIRLFIFIFFWYWVLLFLGSIHFELWQLEVGIGLWFGLGNADVVHYWADFFFQEDGEESNGLRFGNKFLKIFNRRKQ